MSSAITTSSALESTRQRCQVALNILVMAAFSPSWGIRHDELDAAQAASGQAAQEVRPERFSFAVGTQRVLLSLLGVRWWR